MYERSAIVLERYFENLLDYRKEGNIRDNFYNYCELVEKLEKYQVNYQKELAATEEFDESMQKVKTVQALQEKLYKKSAKLEYNRNLLFSNIDGKIDDTRKGIEKIESDVDKNNEAMKEAKEKLLNALTEYNDKRFELSKCKRYKKIAEKAYNEALEEAKINFEAITPESISSAKEFSKFEDAEDIIVCLEKNGKGEKIPFNQEVIENATLFGIDMAKKETAGYLTIYDKMNKLLSDIENGVTKIELHKKYLKNEKAKMDFILAVKNYIVQFLDYERMTVIHGRKSHNRLMSEACENFNNDIIQINNLFELLIREIGNKATKKAYKELYNKSYLIDIQEKEEKFKREKNRVNLNTATLINSNYWRIEGITEIYTIFYKDVSEVFEKDVDEFELPKLEVDEDSVDEVYQEQEIQVEEVKEEQKKEIKKMPFEIDSNVDSDEKLEEIEQEESNDDVDIIDNNIEENSKVDIDFDIFGEKYRDIEFSNDNIKTKKNVAKFDEDIPYEIEDGEENLLINVKPVKNKKKEKNNSIEDFDLTEKAPEKKASKIFKRVKKISSINKKNMGTDIW